MGGSLLTDKARYRAAREDVIERVAREVAGSREPLVLVHGAGSFGHVVAREHDLSEGVSTPEARGAFARVHADVLDLNRLVVRALAEAGAHPLTFSPLALAELDAGRLVRFDTRPVARALDSGCLPVLHGDGALDLARGGGIVSGDEVMEGLARDLKPRQAVFATDVDGLFRGDPREESAVLLERIPARDLESLALGPSPHPDVTGGMAGKARRILAITRHGVPVRVVNGKVPGRIALAIAGEPTRSTDVIP